MPERNTLVRLQRRDRREQVTIFTVSISEEFVSSQVLLSRVGDSQTEDTFNFPIISGVPRASSVASQASILG